MAEAGEPTRDAAADPASQKPPEQPAEPPAGPPPRLTNRRVLAIAGPIVLSNVTVPILGLVDTGVVGQMGEAAPIGAVGLGAAILTALYWVFGFLRMGTSGLTAQAAGARDAAEVSALLMRALLIGGAAGALVVALQGPLLAGAFAVAPAPPEVEDLARGYMAIRIWSAPAAIAIYGMTGWLIALERTRAVLVLQVAMNGLNVGLDLWFVLGLGWGVNGVAFATLAAEWSGLALGLWLCRAAFAGRAWRAWGRIADRARLIRMAAVNGDILIRSLALQGIVVSFLFVSGGLGAVPLAANQILFQFISVTAFALDGFAFSAEALVGQAAGAGSRAGLRRAARLASLWALAVAVALGLAFALAGGLVVDAMTTAPDVRLAARALLPFMVAVPLVGVGSWMLDGIFIGATRTADMRNMMLLTLAVYAAAVALLVPPFGNQGLWAAFLLSYALRVVTLGARYPALERSVAG